jgi:GNAT superfamily N-acetyltransferase
MIDPDLAVPPSTPGLKTEPDERSRSVDYGLEPDLTADEFIDVLQRSTLAQRRPVDNRGRIEQMLRRATVIVTARVNGQLVGVSRALSDGCFATYLSDLAVDVAYQRQGIGRELLERTHQAAGLQSQLILLAAPAARAYYPHIGMTAHDSCWTRPGVGTPPMPGPAAVLHDAAATDSSAPPTPLT